MNPTAKTAARKPQNPRNGEVWKWIAGALLSLVMLLAGGALGHLYGLARVQQLAELMQQHISSAGHEIMIERSNTQAQRVAENTVAVKRVSDAMTELSIKIERLNANVERLLVAEGLVPIKRATE